MIWSFRSKALRHFAEEGDASKLPVRDQDRLRRQLARLDASAAPEDMNIPGFHCHALHGRPKRYSVRVTGNYRLTWQWEDGNAVLVDLEDYH